MMSAICFKIMLGRELFNVRRGKIKQDWQNVHVLMGTSRVHGLFSLLCIFLKFF